MTSWQVVLLEPARTVLSQIGKFVMSALVVIVILFIGWLISKLIKAIVTKSLRVLKIDELSDRIELDKVLEKGGISYSLSELTGIACYWLAMLFTFMVAVNAVGLTVAADLLTRIVLFVPRVIIAVFVLILGMFIATLLKNIVRAAANNAGVAQSKLLSDIVAVIIMVFSSFVALEQLRIGIAITELTLGILLGSIGFGLALAFGLGCKDIAGKFVGDFLDKLKKK